MNETIAPRCGERGRDAASFWFGDGSAVPAGGHVVLEIAVGWGDQLLEAVHAADAEVSVGDLPGCTIAAPVEGRHVVARRVAGGVELVAPPGGRLEAWSDGVGSACAGPLLLGEAGQGVIRIGPLAISLRLGAAVERSGRSGGAVDLAWARALSFSAMGAGFLLAAIGVTPRGEVALGDALFAEGRRQVVYLPKQEEPLPKPDFARPAAPKAPAEEGRIGRFDVKEVEPKARSRHPGRKRERDRALALQSGILRFLDGAGAASGELFSGSGLGQGINEALGGLQGGHGLGDAHGVGALGSRGVGPGGGGDGLHLGGIGTGALGNGPGGGGLELGAGGKMPTRILPGETRVVGGLDKEVIGRVIRSKWAQIRHCYEQALQRDPSLQGKVAVLFTIDGTGGVSVAHVTEDSVGDGAVGSCIVGRIRRWRFPAPKGGGEVVVSYPWIFRAAGS